MDLPSGLDELPTWLSGKEPTCQFRRHRISRFNPWVRRSPGGEMAIHPNILAREISQAEEPGGLQFLELQRVRHDWATHTHTHTHTNTHTPPGPNTQQKCNKCLWDEWTKTWLNYTESINLFSQLESELRERKDLLKVTFGKRRRGDSNQSPFHSQAHSVSRSPVCLPREIWSLQVYERLTNSYN